MHTYIPILFLVAFLFNGTSQKYSSQAVTALNEGASGAGREHFDKGLLLLHNFEYTDAAEEFLLAQKNDPEFVLSYWGEAMTYDHPIWGDLDIDKARNAMKKLGPTKDARLAKAKTPLEQDLLKGLEILFGEGSKPDREKAYAEYMGGLYVKHAGNHDVAAFYALSLLAIKKSWEEWEVNNVRAAEVASEILKSDPDHPGALHYLVHANDHPRYAADGLDAANRYGSVASYAGHALHMPSHIYLALGMWNDVVRSNEVSWQAGVDRKEKKELTNDHLNYHAHLWLSYGYLQQGRWGRARELFEKQKEYTTQLTSARARFHLAQMRGHYLFNTDEWNSPVAESIVRTDDLEAGARFTDQFLEGYRHFRSKNPAALANLIEQFDNDLNVAKAKAKAGSGIAICGTSLYTAGVPSELDLALAERHLYVLRALNAWLGKDPAAAEKFFRAGLPAPGSVVVGPPMFLLSPHEAYAAFLIAMNRPNEAIVQYDKALAASPNRLISLKGKLAAARAARNKVAEATALAKLKVILANADASVTAGLW